MQYKWTQEFEASILSASPSTPSNANRIGDAATRGETSWRRQTVLVALLCAALLIAASWGYATVAWGDYGKWLFEVQRVGEGATLYRDVYWPQLPLAAWLFGAWTWLAGSDLRSIWALTTFIALGIAVAFGAYASRILSREVAPWLTIVALVLAFAAANIESAPLGMGMYTPAAPLGALFLILAVLTALREIQSPALGREILLGLLSGLALVTKIDYWPPVAVAMLAAWFLLPGNRLRMLIASALGAVVVLLPVVVALGSYFGAHDWFEMMTGFGIVREFSGRNLPTLERVALELTTMFGFAAFGYLGLASGPNAERKRMLGAGSALLALIGCCVWVSRGPASAAVEGTLFGWGGTREMLVALVEALARHTPPALAPVFALIVVWRFPGSICEDANKRALLLLSMVAVAARLRRLGEHVDFYQILLELPLYVAIAQHLFTEHRTASSRVVRRFVVAMGAFAAIAYWQLSYGPFTRRGARPLAMTPRGAMHLRDGEATVLRRLVAVADSLDPSRQRPVFGYGYSGGFNYFMRRANPTNTTQGFAFAFHTTAESNAARVRDANPGVLLVDNHFLDAQGFPGKALQLHRWRALETVTPFVRVDRPIFNSIAQQCRVATSIPKRKPDFVMFDCSAATLR